MKEVILTPDQKVDLEALHDASRDKRVCDRIKAVLLRSEGWSTKMIAQALRLHETSIVRHIDDYLKKEKLKPENGGSVSCLSAEQTSLIISHITAHTYCHVHQISEYIWETCEVRFSISGLNKWLHQQGFSYKQPKGVPHKFDEVKQANFIEQYDRLKSSVGDEHILFMDAMHPTQATKVSCGWIKTGTDKSIGTTGSRTRLNLVGAVDLQHIAATHVSRYEKVNSETGRYENEVVYYESVSIDVGTSVATLNNCVRGTAARFRGTTFSNTTASSHLAGAKVFGVRAASIDPDTVVTGAQPATIQQYNRFTVTMIQNSTSTATGGGFQCTIGPVNDRP